MRPSWPGSLWSWAASLDLDLARITRGTNRMMGNTTIRPTLTQRQPQHLAPEVVGDPHQPEVSADEMRQILFALMEQQTS